jgi:hypothetical protein
VGATPTRQPLQPEATGAAMEVNFFLAAWFLMGQSFARQWPQVSIRP